MHSKCSPFAFQKEPFCTLKGVLLEGKRTTFFYTHVKTRCLRAKNAEKQDFFMFFVKFFSKHLEVTEKSPTFALALKN